MISYRAVFLISFPVVGRRRFYLSTQIDDMHLYTAMYIPNGTTFRVVPADLTAHIAWQASVNQRLPAGSNYTIEIGHNGNGDIDVAVNDYDVNGICNPETAIYYADQVDTPLEFQKPLGTGTSLWPTDPANYTWSLSCAQLDPLAAWFNDPANRDNFMHISHTFSHENLDNATYSDTYREINFNIAWLKQIGIYDAKWFSPQGLIPPAITGVHNGDAIRAWMDQGIIYAVGDNSRPVLLNTENEFWPLISSVAGNGYDGLTIMGRWVGPIYYNCDTPNCTLQEWIDTSHGSGDFNNLLDYVKSSQMVNILALRQDPQMFHQANMRASDMPSMTIGNNTGNFSLLMMWVETIIQEYIRLVTWPVLTLKHDDLGVAFTNRMTRE
jgi:hypothetical protein